MRASVLIVSYRTPDLTLAAVQSAVAAADVDEVIVVDNASHDETVGRLDTLGEPKVHVVKSRTNRGFGAATNLAASKATGDVLVLLNSDAMLCDGCVDHLVDVVAALGGRCLAGARLVTRLGEVQHSAGMLPTPVDLALRALGLAHLRKVIYHVPIVAEIVRHTRLAIEYESAVSATQTIGTNMLSGACLAIGREAFWELGGFDERYFMYFEDGDLCRRAAAGMPIRYVPSAVVTHIGGASSSEDYHFGPLHARSMRQYLGKWYGPAGSALAILLLWLRAVGFSIALRPQSRRAWRALWAAITDADPRL